jgi:hypothetical protein
MGGIFSTLSGYFTKSFIIGALFPVVLFLFLFSALVIAFFLQDIRLIKDLESLDAQWKVAGASLFVLVFAVLIYNLNLPILRLYEGYPWKDSFVGLLRTRHYKKMFDRALSRVEKLWALAYALNDATKNDATNCGDGHPAQTEILDVDGIATLKRVLDSTYEALKEEAGGIYEEYPSKGYDILPTRLGNVIRAFESYPFRQYKIEAITFWPRLTGTIESGYASAIDDAKTSFDFMLNCSALSSLSAMIALGVGLVHPIPFTSVALFSGWLAEVLSFALLGWLFYIWSISQAKGWGGLVKGAFDLYRWDLLKQLGHNRVPQTLEEERDLWDSISVQIIYGDSPRFVAAPYGIPTTEAHASPERVKLQVTRGVTASDDDRSMVVTVRARNPDPELEAEGVVISDTLPDGFMYKWDSAKLSWETIRSPEPPQAELAVEGVGPYRFGVGNLGGGQAVVLTYVAVNTNHKSGTLPQKR